MGKVILLQLDGMALSRVKSWVICLENITESNAWCQIEFWKSRRVIITDKTGKRPYFELVPAIKNVKLFCQHPVNSKWPCCNLGPKFVELFLSTSDWARLCLFLTGDKRQSHWNNNPGLAGSSSSPLTDLQRVGGSQELTWYTDNRRNISSSKAGLKISPSFVKVTYSNLGYCHSTQFHFHSYQFLPSILFLF